MKKVLTIILVLCFVVSALSLPLVSAAEDSWTTLTPMPTARSGLGVAVVDGKIYAIGGYNGSYLADNEMYDPEIDMWITKTSMPTRRGYFAIAVYQNKIYAIGGMVTLLGNTRINEVYDTLTDTWETKSGLPDEFGCEFFCANNINDKIYVISGLATPLPPFHNSNKNYVYNPANDSWTTKAPILNAVHGYSSAVVDNRIYVIGGRYIPSNTIYNLTQIYNPETDTWSYKKPFPVPIYGETASATSGIFAPKRIHIMYYDSHYVYDPEVDTWITGTPMLTPRSGVGVAVVNDELYAIGGRTEVDIHSTVNEKYTPIGYIPEFPSWIILPLFMISILVMIVIKKHGF